jgi:transcriptional regulator with XRE-family HTH domain
VSEIIQVTGRQIAAARALGGLDQATLAGSANISIQTLRRIESAEGAPSGYPNNIAAVRAALEKAGVEFIAENGGGPGVRLKKRAKSVEEISQQIDVLEDKISSIPAPTTPSPEAAMNTMRKAVAENNVAKLKARRKRIRRDGSK